MCFLSHPLLYRHAFAAAYTIYYMTPIPYNCCMLGMLVLCNNPTLPDVQTRSRKMCKCYRWIVSTITLAPIKHTVFISTFIWIHLVFLNRFYLRPISILHYINILVLIKIQKKNNTRMLKECSLDNWQINDNWQWHFASQRNALPLVFSAKVMGRLLGNGFSL